jgi:hypothetical protein
MYSSTRFGRPHAYHQELNNCSSSLWFYRWSVVVVVLLVVVGPGLVSRPHTTTHHSRYDSSGQVISPSQRPLPDNTQHSQQTNIHARGGIRTHDLSRRAAADPQSTFYTEEKYVSVVTTRHGMV